MISVVLNVLPSGRKLYANKLQNWLPHWGRFLAANRIIGPDNARSQCNQSAPNSLTHRLQSRAEQKMPHLMVRGFAARVKPEGWNWRENAP
jgi:hypothetical protein